jgi:preprotein translocase subunit SecE
LGKRVDASKIHESQSVQVLQEVRAEGQKVTWPSRRETAITTAMVFILTAVAAVFFLYRRPDHAMVVTLVLSIGG